MNSCFPPFFLTRGDHPPTEPKWLEGRVLFVYKSEKREAVRPAFPQEPTNMTSLDMFVQDAFLLAPEVEFNKSKSWTTGQLLNRQRTNSMGKLQGIGSVKGYF